MSSIMSCSAMVPIKPCGLGFAILIDFEFVALASTLTDQVDSNLKVKVVPTLEA